MPTTFDTPFTDLTNQWIEASTRALTASAELYTQALRAQADATRELVETYAGLGSQTTERTEQATAQVARETGRATQRATRRTATATRRAAKRAKPAAKATARAAAKPATAAPPAAPPIGGYDDLNGDELVAKLAEQPQVTLAAIAAYERAHGNRSTVLERVEALTGPEPAPGYDEMTADQAQAFVRGADAALAAAVREYERRHKARASVLEAAARDTDAS